jgi:uncharacterized membrane protein HdeD (DUF308 family)
MSFYAGEQGTLHEDGLDLQHSPELSSVETKDGDLDIGRITIFFLAIVVVSTALLALSHPVLAVAVLVIAPGFYALWKAVT